MTTKKKAANTTESRSKNREETLQTAVKDLLKHPEKIGIRVGFRDMTRLHGKWIREIVFGKTDYTLQAHRGSYKSSSLAVGIALIMVLDPTHNIIFLRKADNDVAEMLRMVVKILRSEIMNDISNVVNGAPIEIINESMDQVSTNLYRTAMGAPQLLGIGIKSSITGKHAHYVITDDICNIQDYQSAAEREHTKLQYDELQNIRNRGGRIINLGTPWHKKDVFRKMPNIHRYDCYTTGLISAEELAKLRKSMAPRLFAANYELKLIAASELVFTEPPQFVDMPEEEVLWLVRGGDAHIDAAYGGADYTALTIGKIDRQTGVIYLYGRLWHKSVDRVFPQILEELERFKCWRTMCESNADRGFLRKKLFEAGLYASNYHETQNKKIKILTHLRQCWPRIRFIPGTDPAYIRQIVEYTEFAEHDDAPDSAATMCRFYTTYHWEAQSG